MHHSYIWPRWPLRLLLLAGALGCTAAGADSISGEAHVLGSDQASWRWRVADCAPTLEAQWWSAAGDVLAS